MVTGKGKSGNGLILTWYFRLTQSSSHPSSPTDTTAPIGIFDSGVGGISILREIRKALPHENLVYIADSKNAPYGDKSQAFIQQQSLKLAHFLIEQMASKALVVACNTATTEAIRFLREHVTVPVVGVEPAIKPAAQISKNKTIGILATHRTINSQRLQALIDHYAAHCTVLCQACPGLVEAIEAEHDERGTDTLIKRYTRDMIHQGIDTLVLGCTHYPFLSERIQAIVGQRTAILETGKPVAAQLQRILQQHELEAPADHLANTHFYSSLGDENHFQTIQKLWGEPVTIRLLPANKQRENEQRDHIQR